MAETEPLTANPEGNDAPQELVFEYQPTDETGKPIGNKTVIKGTSWEEIARKQQDIQVQIVRAYHRLKDSKPTQPKQKFTPKQLTADEEFQAGVELNDPAKARKAIRKLVDAEFGLTERQEEMDRKAEVLQHDLAAAAFLRRHARDYFYCEANNDLIEGYLTQNGLDYTAENYEIAFAMCEDKLAQSPTVSAPEPTPAAPANPEPRRPRVTPDLQPGNLNGNPRPRAKGLTKADYIRMGRDNPAEYNRHFTTPSLRKEMDKVLGS
jgi:hypothetical protein